MVEGGACRCCLLGLALVSCFQAGRLGCPRLVPGGGGVRVNCLPGLKPGAGVFSLLLVGFLPSFFAWAVGAMFMPSTRRSGRDFTFRCGDGVWV